jgi:hypothetical protein
MSLGEVHWLAAYAAEDRRIYDPDHPLVCSCGAAVRTCHFWTRVESYIGRPLTGLRLHVKSLGKTAQWKRSMVADGLKRLAELKPSLYDRGWLQRALGTPALVRDSEELFDAVTTVSGRRISVDSSKSVARFRLVYQNDPERNRAIVLSRDVRAVVHSKMKRGRSLEGAARGWRRKMNLIAERTADLPRQHVHVLKYEELCESPLVELAKICEFLGVGMTEAMTRRASVDVHHIGGSPSKFDENRKSIVLDRTYEGYFGDRELQRIRAIAGAEAGRWGY